MALGLKARMFQGGQTVKTGTKFVIRDTTQCISLYLNVSLFSEHTGKQFVYPNQKLDRETHPESGVGVLDEEEGIWR